MKRFYCLLPILCLLFVSFTSCESETVLQTAPSVAESEVLLPALNHSDFKHTVRIPILSSDGQSKLVLDVSFNDDDLLDAYQPGNFELTPNLNVPPIPNREFPEQSTGQEGNKANLDIGNTEGFDREETEILVTVVEAVYADGINGMDVQMSAMGRRRVHLYGYTWLGKWYNSTLHAGNSNSYWAASSRNGFKFFASDTYHSNRWTRYHTAPFGSYLSLRTHNAVVIASHWLWY